MREKFYLYISIAFTILSLSAAPEAKAQIAISETQSSYYRESIDTDIWNLRNTIMPDFRIHADDITQYAPAAVMLGLKAFGYESRSSWARMLTADAFSIALQAAFVNGIKYTAKRLRPDGTSYNSFPSGHTATAFMTATMLHMEYGWRSPWFSIGGYTVAAFTGVSRIMNNRHWMSDVIAGAAIGVGAVHLGYFLSDLIFKEGLSPNYEKPVLYYDSSEKHYVAELIFGRRFIIGAEGQKDMNVLPTRGGLVGISTDVPIIPGLGITARGTASSMSYKSKDCEDMYSMSAGPYWNLHFARILELQAKAMVGCAWFQGNAGIDLSAGLGLSVIISNNFKLKGFADFESFSLSENRPWINSAIVGYSASWFW